MIADDAMPVSTAGSGTPMIPSTPPKAITSGNTIGSSQIAGYPRKAPHSPTATIATTWSGPNTGWERPARKPPALSPVWASAGMAARERIRVSDARFMRASLRRLLLLRDADQPTQDRGRALEPLLGPLPIVEEHDLHVRAHARSRTFVADVTHQPFGIGELIIAELQHRALRPGIDFFDIGA